MKLVGLCAAIILISASAWLLWPASKSRNLRGSYVTSADNKTYLIISDDNGGGCKPLIVDGAEWAHKTGEAGPISPGIHQIQCGKGDSGISFEVPGGTLFSFDYWGP